MIQTNILNILDSNIQTDVWVFTCSLIMSMRYIRSCNSHNRVFCYWFELTHIVHLYVNLLIPLADLLADKIRLILPITKNDR